MVRMLKMASQVEEERKRWERKHRHKPVVAEKVKRKEEKQQMDGSKKIFMGDIY